jgi:CubicO group peptidase (beta-lactamase class C family)
MSKGGFSESRLERMHETMAGHVESGFVPGLVTLVSRRGETHVDVIGTTAFDSGDPMRRDTIFRIASVTKPIVAAAAMILVEECKLRLDDPVDALLPELADRQVLRTLESPLDDTVPAHRPITLRDLLTFRLGYGAIFAAPGQYPIQAAIEEAGLAAGPHLPEFPPDEFMARYGDLPLLHQPGEKWLYNTGSDILGVLIARAADMTLGEFLQERIFNPLGMKDTAFSVPAGKRDRLAESYWTNFETGEFGIFDPIQGSRFARPPAFESGAGGLVSTVDDLFNFAQMMLDNGKFGDERILSRPSVTLMTTDQITLEQKAASASEFFPGFWDSNGWGFGVAINTHRSTLAATPGRYGWDGGYGTSWYVDPGEELIGILLTQRVWDAAGPLPTFDFWTAAYQAIDD